MDKTTNRLVKCFRTVFPGLKDEQVVSASQDTLTDWDSSSAVFLVDVIQEEFGIEMDLDAVPDLDSFDKILVYLKDNHQIS
jgi:acyl carrier protein